ncbi:MAG: helix-turn-helix domain-containing protein [Saccharofermentans sp.]|nr:helix-turn-helix domain-containing protein [Saccharofermentans sp.]
MDPIRIGAFLKELRKERNMTQEAIAGKFGVTQRSVSRWENGTTMPDISVLIELADFYDVDIRDLLRGERESENMDTDMKETLEMVAEYTEADKAKLLKRVYVCGQGTLIASVALFIVHFISFFTDELILTPLILIIACGIFGLNTLLSGLQLKGKMSKERRKKLFRITIIIWVVVAVILVIFMTFFLPKILVDSLGLGTPVS